jgi:arylsulfatase A-like enzyme
VRGIVLIVIDTLRADRLGAYGYDRPTSPRLDALAREAVVFDSAWASAPWTVPSVASLLTSTIPSFHGHREAPQPGKVAVLSGGLTTLPELLKSAGYRTLAVSAQSWVSPATGFAQGFAAGDFELLAHERRAAGPDRRIDSRATRRAIQRLRELGAAWRRGEDGGFFLYVHYMGPHTPYDPPAELLAAAGRAEVPITPFVRSLEGVDPYHYHVKLESEARAGRVSRDDALALSALYDGLVRYVDGQVGQLLDTLAEAGLERETVVVVTSDHGEAFLEHGRLTHGSTLHEEELRVPLIVRAPGWGPARRSDLVGLVDVMPTLLALAGLSVPSGLDGRDLRGPARPAQASLVSEATHRNDQARLATADLRLILEFDGARTLLYDAEQDPHERRDVSAARRGTTRRLRETLERRLAEAAARGRSLERGSREMDAQTRERLRALGYLN